VLSTFVGECSAQTLSGELDTSNIGSTPAAVRYKTNRRAQDAHPATRDSPAPSGFATQPIGRLRKGPIVAMIRPTFSPAFLTAGKA
jgi:hypothetical protein